MFSQYFGHYLLNKGLILPGQLADALEYQRSVHLRLGVIAINAGLMTPEQVQSVHNMQKKVDRRFGEIAVEQGFINEEQLNSLINTQKQGHLLLGQALIDRNYFTLEQLQNALENYKKESGISNRQFNVIRTDDTMEIERIFQNFGENLLSKTYSDYVTLLVKNMIRFVDDNPAIEIHPYDQDRRYDWFVTQQISGKINLRTGIACDTNVFVKFATWFAQENITQPDELAQASVGEFLNLHNGIFLVNMSNNGIELEMEPQAVTQDVLVPCTDKMFILTCRMSWGMLDFYIG